MNKFTSSIIAAAFAFGTLNVYAATTDENTDDASNLGTAESPQKKQQEMRTDKGVTEMQTDPVQDDASNLGNAESPQVQKQNARTNKGASENPSDHTHKKSKLMKTKEKNSGTTKGNQIQPNQPEGAAPATK